MVNPSKRVLIPGLLSLILIIVGATGFRIISGGSATWLNCFYMTLITITTVGFGEIIDLSHNPAGRVFTMFVLVMGMGVMLFFISSVTAMVVEGDIAAWLRRRKLMREIDKLEGHYIVCGVGLTGIHVAVELLRTGRKLVVVDRDAEAHERLARQFPDLYIPFVQGDATEEATLKTAGTAMAAGLISCLPNDKDSLICVYTANVINGEALSSGQRDAKLRIVSEVRDLQNMERMRKAGADAVVSPNFIGGMRMASEMMRPTVVTFLDKMLRDREKNLRVEEMPVPEASPFIGKSLRELNLPKLANLMLLAIQLPGGQDWLYNPQPETRILPGMVLVFMGSPEDREKMERAARAT